MANTPADNVPGSAPPSPDHDSMTGYRDPAARHDRSGTIEVDRTDRGGYDPATGDPTMAPMEPAQHTQHPQYADPPNAPLPPEVTPPIARTRISGTWVAVIVAAIVLIFLLVFILQNLTTVTVEFLGFAGSLPLGVAMLFSAIAGAILVALVGTARILQLRRYAKKVSHH